MTTAEEERLMTEREYDNECEVQLVSMREFFANSKYIKGVNALVHNQLCEYVNGLAVES
jgi:hypothetical protein